MASSAVIAMPPITGAKCVLGPGPNGGAIVAAAGCAAGVAARIEGSAARDTTPARRMSGAAVRSAGDTRATCWMTADCTDAHPAEPRRSHRRCTVSTSMD
eukprot:6052029-Prymnesium_polylepis.1